MIQNPGVFRIYPRPSKSSQETRTVVPAACVQPEGINRSSDAVCMSTLLQLCADTHQYEKAMAFLSDMDLEDQSPSRVTMEVLFRAAASAPQWIRVSGELPL